MADHSEDLFDDDDLDDLPEDALTELENNAIQFTQTWTQVAKPIPPSSDYGDEFEDDDLDDAVLIDESRSTPAIVPVPRRSNVGQNTGREQLRQGYGAVLNSNPALANRQLHNAPPKFAQPSRHPIRVQLPQAESMLAQQGSLPSTQAADVKVESLQQQIEELLKERNALKEDLNAKAGEIAIVRSKQEKSAKEHERELTAVRKLNEDKLAKQQKLLDAARIAEKNAAIDRDFIKRDLAESERNRRIAKAKETEQKDSVTTPRKKKALPHRDGFDDNEIEVVSPSKLSPSKFQKRNAGTPTKPGKRKRKAVDSPAGALEVFGPEELPVELEHAQPVLDEAIIATLSIQDDRFDFLGAILDHRCDADHLRTLEELGKYALPSSLTESFQSKILGQLPVLGQYKSPKELCIAFCEFLISVWKSCFDEKFYQPIYLFIDLLTFALELKTSLIAPQIIDSLLPLAQSTIDLVTIPRFKRETIEHEKDIDVTACMSILYLAAQGCMYHQEDITRFWRLMRWDFILFMLATRQVRADTEVMLRLLSTSIMNESFGAIAENSETQYAQTGYNLDRLGYPIYPVGTEDVATGDDIPKLRIQILQLLTSMTRSPHASKAMALHPFMIGRLVCSMSDELDDLYDYKTGREDSARIISLTTRLLYHLITKYDNIIDMQKKLAVVHGGAQKYLLCLSRLNFSEGDLILEAGIDEDIPACALELLELVVTPEEGDAIQSAFSNL